MNIKDIAMAFADLLTDKKSSIYLRIVIMNLAFLQLSGLLDLFREHD